jgi:hypothetical protein
MVAAQGGQSERVILPNVLFVADANERPLEQPHDGGEHLLARQPGTPEIWTDPHVDPRRRNDERFDPPEHSGVRDGSSGAIDVADSRLAADPADARQHAIVHMVQMSERCGANGIEFRRLRDLPPDQTKRSRQPPLLA